MLKDSTFTVNRSPFKFKSSSYAKSSPRKHSAPSIQASIPQTNHLSISPYRISHSKNVGRVKPLRTAGMQRQGILSRCSSGMKNRTNSANYLSAVPMKSVEAGFQEQEGKMKTSRALFTRSISTKNIRHKSQLTFKYDHQHYCERKFIISVVNIDKKKEKSRKLMNQKLENFNYKTVLGDKFPFKKIPKLFIDEHGVASRQHF